MLNQIGKLCGPLVMNLILEFLDKKSVSQKETYEIYGYGVLIFLIYLTNGFLEQIGIHFVNLTSFRSLGILNQQVNLNLINLVKFN